MNLRLATTVPEWVVPATIAALIAVGIILDRFLAPFVKRKFIGSQQRRKAQRRIEEIRERDVTFGPEVSSLISPAALKEILYDLARTPSSASRTYVTTIHIEGLRCFESIDLRFRLPWEQSGLTLPNVTLLLGDNGSGKSTILKAVAMAALGPVLGNSGFVPYRLVRDRAPVTRVTAQFVFDSPSSPPREGLGRIRLEKREDIETVTADHSEEGVLFREADPAFLVLGYGVHRRVAEDERDSAILDRGRRRARYQRIAGLFDENSVLTPLRAWLPFATRARRSEIADLLNACLPTETHFVNVDQGEVMFAHRGVAVPFRALSDGYKSLIGWLGDLFFQLDAVAGQQPLNEIGGIVLVDEVDLLLHPAWQRDIVATVAKLLPSIQFIMTTHSPIVAGTLQAGNILVARARDDESSEIVQPSSAIHGLDADQILLSPYFGLESTRAPDSETELEGLANRAMRGDDQAALAYLRVLARGQSASGESDRPR